MKTLADLDLLHLPMETPEFAADPFPHFAAARAKHPWLARSIFGYVATEYGAMKDLLWLDTSLRTANDGVVEILGAKGSPFGRFAEENIFNQQGAAHRRLRDAVAPIFTPRHANEIRPMIREAIDGLLDEWLPKGSFDFAEFASWFPISVISRMIGGPDEAIAGLRPSLETWSLAFAMDRAMLPDIDRAVELVEGFLGELIARRRTNPGRDGPGDLLDMLIAASADGRLNDREIVLLVGFMYVAGYDTSKNVLTLIMRQMIERPDLYERCAADAEFCRKVVEEMLLSAASRRRSG